MVFQRRDYPLDGGVGEPDIVSNKAKQVEWSFLIVGRGDGDRDEVYIKMYYLSKNTKICGL